MLQPEYKTLGELLQYKLFQVPEFQRAYSWGKREREDLFEDINTLFKKPEEKHHFMATTVFLDSRHGKKNFIGADAFQLLDIVDGQQRITTLILLLKSIDLKMKEVKSNQKDNSNLERLLVKDDGQTILLTTNHDKNGIFPHYLRDGKIAKKGSTQGDKNLIDGIKDCQSFVERWVRDKKDLVQLIRLVNHQLGFISFVLRDEGAVYTVFEVLNSRGLEVDWLDKTKSMLMGIVFDKFSSQTAESYISQLHNIWQAIYEKLGERNISGQEIIRFAATLKEKAIVSRSLSAEDSYESLKGLCSRHPKKVIEIARWLKEVTEELVEFDSKSHLSAVTNIAHARLLAIAINHSKLAEKDKERVLEKWEKVTFKIFGLSRKDARTSVGEYTRLAYKIYNGKTVGYGTIMKEIKEIGESHPIDDVISQMQGEDCYNGWSNELRYFLYKYEEDLHKRSGTKITSPLWDQIWSASAHKTIEHILPKTPSTNWRGAVGRGNSLEKIAHKLGNLILLPPEVNSSLGQKSFKDKKKVYNDNFLKMYSEIVGLGKWDYKSIEKREQKLLDWAKNYWED